MVGKFALVLCPEDGCPKVALTPEAECPTHKVAMVRTVLWTDTAVQQKIKQIRAEPTEFERLAREFGRGRR